MRKALKKFKPEVIHTHDYKSAFYVAMAGIGLAACRVATIHGWTDRSASLKAYAMIERLLLQHLYDAVVCVDPKSEGKLAALGFDAERIFNVPNGVDLQRFRPKENKGTSSSSVVRFAAIGRLSHEKGPDLLLEAMSTLTRHNNYVRLRYFGDGPMRAALESRSIELGLSSFVEFMGVSADIPSVLSECDCLVLPSRTEGMPIIVLEAMASGTAVIATDVGAVRALIRDGAGILVPPEQPQALAEAMARVAEDATARSKMARTATKIVQEFSAQAQSLRLNTIYSAVVKRA